MAEKSDKTDKKTEKKAGAKPEGAEPKPAAKAAGAKGEGGGKKGKGQKAAESQIQVEAAPSGPARPARLRVKYIQETIPALMKEFGYKNPNQVPKLQKIVVNMGLGEALANNKLMDAAVEQLALITGQKPVITKSRKAIANFKLRAGQSIGAMVTLRSARMYEFLDRLMNVALPRVRDFKGVSSKAFDGSGNYTLGVREQIIFPEINYDRVEKIKGMNITVVTSAQTDEEGRALLRHLGMPFRA
jgi:large subunit ribosomal protein L5